MGRYRKPTALKVINGSAKHDPQRIKKNEPKPRRGAPGMPTWLMPEAKAEWRRIVPELERLGVLTKVDRAVVAAHCQIWARIHEAETVGRGATPSLWTQLRLTAAKLGLDPSSRGSIETKPQDAAPNAFAQIVAAKAATSGRIS